MGTCIVIGLSFCFCFQLRQSGFHQIVKDGVRRGVRRKWKRSILILPSLIPSRLWLRFSQNNVISAFKTPLAIPTLVILNLIVTASCPLTYLFNVWLIISKSFILCVSLKALLIVFIALETSVLDGKPFYLILWWNLVGVKPLIQYMRPISINWSNIVIMLLFLYFPYDSFFFFVVTLLKARLIPDT